MLVSLVKDLKDDRTSVTTIDEVHLPNTAVNTGHTTPQGWAIWSIVPEHIAKWGKKVKEEVKTLEADAANVVAEVETTANTGEVAKLESEVKTEAEKVVAEVKAEANTIVTELSNTSSEVIAEVEKLVHEVEAEGKTVVGEVEEKAEGLFHKLEDLLHIKHS